MNKQIEELDRAAALANGVLGDRRAAASLAASLLAEPATEPRLIPLGPVDAAYVAMVEQEFRAATLQAQQVRSARFSVMIRAHQIPEGAQVEVVPREDGTPSALRVTPPSQ